MTWKLRGLVALLGLFGLTEILIWSVPLPPRLGVSDSPVAFFRDGRMAHVLLAPDDRWRIRRTLDEVDPNYLKALLRFEDKRFYNHLGVDPIAIVRAFLSNLRAGRVVSGGSTITMQLVRMVEPRNRRISSKIIESLRAYQVERHYSKDQILEAYLRFLPFGGNLEGIEAASRGLFGHGADALSADEIALLLAIPQRPTRLRPRPGRDKILRTARSRVLDRLNALGVWDDQAVKTANSMPIPDRLRPLPRELPHTVRWLQAQKPELEQWRTTLDRAVQRAARAQLERRHEVLSHQGIHNGAVVVLDRSSGEIRALVGNMDFWDRKHGGQIIAYDQPRSVGSTLKPFLYAQGIQDGLLLPETLVLDLPRDYGGYRPGNYDGVFQGLVAASEALAQSRNLPFIDLLSRLGVDQFLGLMESAGAMARSRHPEGHGLSAAVGAVELTPLEVTSLYSMLASGGRFLPPTWWATSDATPGHSLLAEGPVWLTSQSLARYDRPDSGNLADVERVRPTVHWKTGTSYGYRDAWTAGWSRRFVVTVWLGNLDNSGSRHLVGSVAASPLFFDLIETLESGPIVEDKPPAPQDLSQIEVCHYSGHVPSPACSKRKRVWAYTQSVPTQLCPYHVHVEIDEETGEALNASCRSGRSWTRRSMLRWPASLRRYLNDDFSELPQIPALAAHCQGSESSGKLRILSPTAEPILLIPGVPLEVQEVPLLAEAPDGRPVSWFVDGVFLGTVRADEPIWWQPKQGEHRLLLQSEAGQKRRLTLQVRRFQ